MRESELNCRLRERSASPGLTQVGPELAAVAGAALRGLLAEPWVQDAPALVERCRSLLDAR
jgi:hypothetical protein